MSYVTIDYTNLTEQEAEQISELLEGGFDDPSFFMTEDMEVA